MMRNGGNTGGRRFIATAAILIIGSFAGGCSQPAQAPSYYVCDCLEAADGDCVAGEDGNDGLSRQSPWRTYDRARSAFASIEAGDRIRFCRGGAFEAGSDARWVNDACRASRPCRVSDYRPPWGGGDEMRPIVWQPREDGYGFAFENGGSARHQEGYAFENLDVRGAVEGGTARFGFFMYNDIDDVTLRNVHVEGFVVGIHIGGSNGCASGDPACDGVNERIHLRDSSVVYNSEQGWLGGSSGSTIENSYFEGNGTRARFDHNIYVSSTAAPTVGMRVVGNRSYRSAPQDDGSCGGVSIVVHGVHTDLAITGNTVWEDPGAAQEECWGIAVDSGYGTAESFTDVVIRGNTVRNVGNVSIGLSSCVDCVVENNVIVNEQAFAVRAIVAPDRDPGVGDAELAAVVVRSNSIYLAGASSSTGIELGGEGSDHSIVSNAIHYGGTGANWDCIRADLVPSAYTEIDYNLCYFPSAGSNAEWADGAGSHGNVLRRWQLDSGLGSNSRIAVPGFTQPTGPTYDLSAAGSGSNSVAAGDAAVSASYDYFDRPRGQIPDIGAHQWGNAEMTLDRENMRRRARRMARLKTRLGACLVSRAKLRCMGEGGNASELPGVVGLSAPVRPISRVRAQLRKCTMLLEADETV